MRAVQILTPFFVAYAASAARVSQHSHGERNDSDPGPVAAAGVSEQAGAGVGAQQPPLAPAKVDSTADADVQNELEAMTTHANRASLSGVNTTERQQVAGLPVVDKVLHAKAVQILERFKVTIAVPEDLYVLQDYDVVIIADDSGSMSTGSRWKELQDSLSQIVTVGSVFDDDGLDIFFLNRPVVTGVRSADDKHFLDAFSRGPGGTTPLTVTVDTVMRAKFLKPVLLFIMTDGVPDKGVATFRSKIGSIVNNKRKPVKVQIMACTEDDNAVGWLDELDEAFDGVDVTDDYDTERAQVLRIGKVAQFNRGDWCMKAMLGPISRKFDELDEDAKLATTGRSRPRPHPRWRFR